jgi:putative colanic acid biosynthesis acetyltransferase WcaF
MIDKSTFPDLSLYDNGDFSRGRPALVVALWLIIEALFVASWLPGSLHRRLILRLFGARIGSGVVIKPRVRVKFPWRLRIGDHSWIGEGVWIDNLNEVRIGSNACLSQGAYLCTGNHDWSRVTFDLRTAPIVVEDGAWVGEMVSVGPGVTIGHGAVATLGMSVLKSLEPGSVHYADGQHRLRRMERDNSQETPGPSY